MNECVYEKSIQKWDVCEVIVNGYSNKNPFVDYEIVGYFKSKNETKQVAGFYDGDSVYKVRFMPSYEGIYTFQISGSFSSEEYEGEFEVTKPTKNNHGPVRVAKTYHFAYEDTTPYYSVGTTCYAWIFQHQTMQEKTLETLRNSTFNKIRFCVFPKHYDYNLKEPISYPYEGTPIDNSVLTKENFDQYNGNAVGNNWDLKRLNPLHFQLIEGRIKDLMDLGIEADIIVMHPYDRWGFSQMDKECDDLYWNYVIARFATYRNVWWSLANEYDLMPQKTTEDWERYGDIIFEKDPYNHLRSIHNCHQFYDHTRPWITHCSIQGQEMFKAADFVAKWRALYNKPVVLDEISYEGNINHGWGNISAKELVKRFWEISCGGGYAGHGETYMHPEDKLWWSHGGELHGESPERIKFLYQILCETPDHGLEPIKTKWDEVAAVTASTDELMKPVHNYYLYYYGLHQPSFRNFYFDEDNTYEVELIDTWDMNIENKGQFKGRFTINMPGKEYMSVRIRMI